MAHWVASSVCGVLVVLLAGSHALPALHYALQEHEICADHGELTHASSDDHSVPSADSQASAAFLAADEHEHEHCKLVATTTANAILACRTAPERALHQQSLESPRANASDAHSSVALLAYAPKLAPPA